MVAVLEIVLFLAAALWLAALAERAGLARRAAAALARGPGRSPYALVCLTCAALTATLSLDGAVVLLVPLVDELAAGDARLRRMLLLGGVAVANAFSLAVPQGNPTNLVVMHALGLSPGAYISHMALPALGATLLCAVLVRRRTSSGPLATGTVLERPLNASWGRGERVASAALAAAALGATMAPWLGVNPLWVVVASAVLTLPLATLLRVDVPPLFVPWRIGAQIAALAALVGLLPAISVRAASLPAAIALALGAAALAGLVNNLPASVALAGVLRAPGLGAYAALAGLSVGALATPRGSVATMIAFRRGGTPAGHRAALAPAAIAATLLAVAAVWALG
jgi:arsenical pump membrane protein